MSNNKKGFEKHIAKSSDASKYTLDSTDVKKIIGATESIRDKVIIEMLAFTGCRRAELCLLRIKDVDLENERIMMPTVKQGENALNHLREIPILNTDLKRDLRAYIELLNTKYPRLGLEDKLVQSQNTKAQGITTTMVSIIVRDTAKRAGVKSPNPNRKWVQPHLFRHTFVRYAIKCGLNFKVIQQIVGHADISTTMGLYGEPSWDDKKEELKKMEGFGNE